MQICAQVNSFDLPVETHKQREPRAAHILELVLYDSAQWARTIKM